VKLSGSDLGWVFPAVLFCAILVPFFLFADRIDVWLTRFLSGQNGSAIIALILSGLLAGDIVLPIPSSVISAACGYTLGAPLGLLVSWFGMTLGCLGGYYIGQRSRKVRYFSSNGQTGKMEMFFSRYGNWTLMICRAIPVLAESSVVYAGFCGMPFTNFLWMTVLSNLGISAVYAFTGALYSEKHSFYLAFFASAFVPVLLAGLVRLTRRGPHPGKS
jgi:uncharacterized membrane protein YdjX (TVP38/TMEM64 family)